MRKTAISLPVNRRSAVATAVRRLLCAGLSIILISLWNPYSVVAAPCTDTWTATTTAGAAGDRTEHSAVWTGSEMIVWGGYNSSTYVPLNTGGRYNPATNTWRPISTINAPTARFRHTAVWTGKEMIVWGGSVLDSGAYLETNTGARYDPVSDTWIALPTLNAPARRDQHTAVWTGTEMIVWGGSTVYEYTVNTGAAYSPDFNTWHIIPTDNAPAPRYRHSAIWTGSEMIVWGGINAQSYTTLNDGARYNPATASWHAISTSNAPSLRSGHTAIWTGSELIVWGGRSSAGPLLNTGAKYSPGTDSWRAISVIGVPVGRHSHSAVWTGNEMIIWGGSDGWGMNTGGRYSPAQDTWAATSLDNTPQARGEHSAFWTGSQMLIWGGHVQSATQNATVNTGGLYCAAVPGQLLNISTRMRVLTGNNALIGGFIVSGTAQKKVIVRGIGPSLTNFGVVGALNDPVIELHDSSKTLASNDNWKDTQETEVEASGLAPTNDSESAIVTTLPANSSAYTVVLADKNAGTGIGLVEIYDLSPSDSSMLVNISTRGFVDTDNNVMIGGLIVGSGDRGPTKILVRGIGPSLSNVGINNPLQDPTLELSNSSGAIVATNDNWKVNDSGGSQEDEIRATGIVPTDDRESALVRSIAPDNYTAILRGKNNATGVGLVEIYNLQQ